jgi:hypothetical protein
MRTDFRELIAVLDDDVSKDGAGYWNLPVKIMAFSKDIDLQKAVVLITAVDNVQPIMKNLLNNRPKLIIHPLNVI